MFLLDAPYVSDFLKETIRDLGLPVLDTPDARRLTAGVDLTFIDEIDFAARLGAGEKVLANSENALARIFDCGCRPELARQIDVCKDKALFRETVAELHPDYRFVRVGFDDLPALDLSAMPTPFVVKPTRGFFSLGVHVVDRLADWPAVLTKIQAERAALNAEYPEAVVSGAEFVVEASIPGEEYAIDVYYDPDGSPVITNILHHHFISKEDISDRLYYTSTRIIETWLLPFTEYLRDMGRECGFHDFATHVEVRVTDQGEIIPIEANPLRFAGWCVADITFHAWGFNPYECYFKNLRPDWDVILDENVGSATVMVIGDLPPGTDRRVIRSVDYPGFQSLFSNLLELRKIDYREYPVFAFAFARMSEAEVVELKRILADDFGRFVEL